MKRTNALRKVAMEETLVVDPMVERAEKFAALRARRKLLEEEVEMVKADAAVLEEELIRMMRSRDIDKFSNATGTFSISPDTFVSIKEENREKAFKFLRKAGVGSIIKETVHAKTLSSTFKQLADDALVDITTCEEKFGLSAFIKERVRVTTKKSK